MGIRWWEETRPPPRYVLRDILDWGMSMHVYIGVDGSEKPTEPGDMWRKPEIILRSHQPLDSNQSHG